MNVTEACSILEIKLGSTEDEVTKSFRKKAAELHPDRNKSDTAEADFKRVNEAYQFLKQNGTKEPEFFGPPGVRFYTRTSYGRPTQTDPYSNFFNQVRFNQWDNIENIFAPYEYKGNLNISFEESILGCEKEITYNVDIKCDKCKSGKIVSDSQTICPKCNGEKTVKNKNNDAFPCNTCDGSGFLKQKVNCNNCAGTGIISQSHTNKLKVQAGIRDGSEIRVRDAGGYINGVSGRKKDIIFKIKILPHREFNRDGDNVVSVVDIDLVDALKGTSKKVNTVKGEKTLKLKPGLKHRDSVQVGGFGVAGRGSHIFILNVKYPENTDELIKFLEKNKQEPEEIIGE